MQEKMVLKIISKKFPALNEEAQAKVRAVIEEGRIKAHKARQLSFINEQIKYSPNDLLQDKIITSSENLSFYIG